MLIYSNEKNQKMESKNTNPALTKVFYLQKYTFVVVPIVAGIDKFLDLLTNWGQYLNPPIVNLLPFSPPVFMKIVGVIEIAAGIIVLRRSKIGGYIVAAWLAVIALTLLISFKYIDVAVRDLVMAIAAFSMARISNYIE